MKVFALTGGIASGKSTISKRFLELGAKVIDADQLAREAVEPETEALQKIAESFGPNVINSDSTLNRQLLGEIVFQDQAKLQILNEIVHPAVANLYQAKIEAIASENPDAIVIYEVPLLAEHAKDRQWQHVIVASAPEEVRRQRLIDYRGYSDKEASMRINNQASEEERISVADTVIDTSKSLEETIAQVDKFWFSINQ